MSCVELRVDQASTTGGVDAWLRYRWVWHLLTGVVLAILGGLAIAFPDGSATGRGVTLALLAFLGGWYATVGVRAMGHDQRWAVLYFGGVLVCFPIVVALRGDGSLLLCYLMPQAFVLFHRLRYGIATAALLQSVVAVAIMIRAELRGWAVVGMIGSAVVATALSAVLGLFISGIIRQSRQRADLIAALERTREELARERHQAGVRAERERLAAEIHDTLAQGFTSILMLTQAARAALSRDPGTVPSRLDVIEQTARENLTEARSLVTTLAPAELTDGSLPEALRRLADMHRRSTGLAIDVTVTGEPTVRAPDCDVVLLRAAQESLHNVGKHAGAHRVALALSYRTTGSVLTVTDNGRGFDPGASHTGYGLRAMRQRVEAWGGTLSVRSAPEAGTTVEVRLPEEAR